VLSLHSRAAQQGVFTRLPRKKTSPLNQNFLPAAMLPAGVPSHHFDRAVRVCDECGRNAADHFILLDGAPARGDDPDKLHIIILNARRDSGERDNTRDARVLSPHHIAATAGVGHITVPFHDRVARGGKSRPVRI
jgi:hypothetical protein